MDFKAIFRCLRLGAVAWLTISVLAASEHHGIVRFGAIAVPGATVTATKGDKKVVAVTDEAGVYQFPDLEDGIWKVQVEMLTFNTESKEIGVAQGVPGAEWELKMQSMDEIKPAAPAAPPAAPASGAAPGTAPAAGAPAGNATPSIVAANGGNAAATAAAGKGAAAAKGKGKKAAAAASTNPTQGFQRADVNASGDAPAASGAAAAGPPVAEASAASDAFVVNGSTSNGIERRAIGNGRKGPRSLFNGGIDFRGFQNDYLDARSYSLTGLNTPRSPYTDYTLGGSVQGPLWAPHVFHWQGNFGVQFQTNRQRNANVQQYLMPTDLERAGNFSRTVVAGSDGTLTPVNVVDPNSGHILPNKIIPSNELSSQAMSLLSFYPEPQSDSPGAPYNYQTALVSRQVNDQLSVRVFKPINNRNTLQFLFVYQDNSGSNNSVFVSTIAPVGQFVDHTKTSNYHGRVSYNHNFNRSVFGQFFVDYTRSAVRSTPFFANISNVSGLAGITGNYQAPVDYGPPGLGFGSSQIAGLSDGNESSSRRQTAWASASLTWYRRPHTFQFGADYKLQTYGLISQANPRGNFGFTGQATGYDFADFLFGLPDTSSINYANADKYLRDNVYDAFINDDWKVSSSFTFQWGLRWDYASPITEEYGRLENLDIGPGYTNPTPVAANQPVGPVTGNHYPSTLIHPDRHQFSPRLSFAWRPIFGSSMVVRGGYGLYYNTSVYSNIAGRLASQFQLPYPLSKNLTALANCSVFLTPQANCTTPKETLANGFQSAGGVTALGFGVDPNFLVGYAHQWYISVQQNLTASLLLTAQYSGVKGTRAAQLSDPNTYPIGSSVAVCPACLAGYSYLTSNGNSTGNKGSLTARRRFHAGISTIFTYAYSKYIDDAPGLGASIPGSAAQNWLNLAGERGLSSFDQKHLFTAALQYSTGVGVHGGALLSGWRGQVLKGWTFTSNINAGSGLPFTPSYPLAIVGGTGLSTRPEYVGGDPYLGTGNKFLNAAAYAAPPTGQFGNAGRDSLIGPKQFSWNGSMQRSFLEKYSFTFNANNVLNHPMVTGWGSTYGSNQFGAPVSVNSMRTLSATFRWTF